MPEVWVRRAIRLLVTPVGLALISAVRLLIVCNYNATTATTVAESGGYVNTFLGSLIPLVPAFMPYLALICLASRRFILAALAVAATVLISPVARPQIAALRDFDNFWSSVVSKFDHNRWQLASLLFAIWVASLFVPWRRMRSSILHSVFHAAWFVFVLFALLPYLFLAYPAPRTPYYYATYMRQPWLTAEQITVDPHKVYEGWVLTSDEKWMTVLLFESRTVAYFPADKVLARHVCQSQPNQSPPLVRLLNATSGNIHQCLALDSWNLPVPRPPVVKHRPHPRPAQERPEPRIGPVVTCGCPRHRLPVHHPRHRHYGHDQHSRRDSRSWHEA